MKFIVLIFLISFSFFTLSSQEKERIAILDFEAGSVSADTAKTVAELLGTELVNTGKFAVIERKQIAKVMNEQGFQMTGAVDMEKAVQVGKLLAVKYLVMGSVAKLGGNYIINGKIVDVESGNVLLATKVVVKNEGEFIAGCETLSQQMVEKLEQGGATNAQELAEKKRNMLESQCSGNNAKSCYQAALMYFRGDGGMKNLEKTKEFFTKSCTSGEGRACHYVGTMYKKGMGGAKNMEKALSFYEKACSIGYSKGCQAKESLGSENNPNSNSSVGFGASPTSNDPGKGDTIPALENYR